MVEVCFVIVLFFYVDLEVQGYDVICFLCV